MTLPSCGIQVQSYSQPVEEPQIQITWHLVSNNLTVKRVLEKDTFNFRVTDIRS